MYDLVVTGGNLFYKDAPTELNMSLGIKDGKIVEVAKNIDTKNAKKVINLEEKLIVPTFMDTHMHIEKAFSMNNDQTYSLMAAGKNEVERGVEYYDWSDEKIFDFIFNNACKVVEMAVKNGTTVIRSNVLFIDQWKTIALDVMDKLKHKYKNCCEIQSAVDFDEKYLDELLKAVKDGRIDAVGGYPYCRPDYRQKTDSCFNIGREYNLPIDLHCDESDVVNLNCFNYIVDKTKEFGLKNLVTCGHVTGLNSTNIPESMASAAVEACAEAGVNVTTLTSCNIYLMNATRRGPTRIPELLESGVNVSIASDNIRDTFRPYGNCDLLEEARLTAQIHKMGTTEKLRQCLEMISYNPSIVANRKNYGLEVGAIADFNIIDAKTPEDAVLDKSKRLYVIKNGNVVAEKGVIIKGVLNA